jgi:regulator of cell morphogenesis and NO signaling
MSPNQLTCLPTPKAGQFFVGAFRAEALQRRPNRDTGDLPFWALSDGCLRQASAGPRDLRRGTDQAERWRRRNAMSDCGLDTPVPDWVIEHPETLATFQELGIDYCCGGKSLAYACRERGLDAAAVAARLHLCLVTKHDEDRLGSSEH